MLHRQIASPWTDIAHRTFLQHMAGRASLTQPRPNTSTLCDFRELSLQCGDVKSTRQQFSNWTHQDADHSCRLSAESHVSFHSLPRRFVVVTLHSADVANPSVVPQEPGISFATFGIQKRASLSLNPLQIISPFPPFFVLRCHFPPPGFRAFHWFRWAYIIHRGPDSGRLNSRHF